jgi:nucleotide-binding universal stress UspA family protein
MYNKILIPLDGSKLAEAVLPFVNEIILGAKSSRKIEITLLQVVPSKRDFVPNVDGESLLTVKVPYSETELEKVKKPIITYLDKIGTTLKQGPFVTIRTLVKVSDDPAEQILNTSDELEADLIAISTHGRSGISRWAFGSVADKILRGGKIPVFMVRAPKESR